MHSNLVVQVLAHADVNPDGLAIVSPSVTMSYGDLAAAVRRTAAGLRKSGVKPGQIVGVRARPEWEAVLTLAIMHEAAVSLHASRPVLQAYAPHIDLVLTEGSLSGEAGFAGRVINVGPAFMESLGAVSGEIEPQPFDGDDVCRVVFSSGTTGTPKGIAFTVATVRARTEAARMTWMPPDPYVCLLGIDTVSGFITFGWCVLNGAPWVIPGAAATQVGVLSDVGARSIKTSPAQLSELLDAIEALGDPPPLALEVVMVTGASLSGQLAQRCRRVLGVDAQYLYGSTEAGAMTLGTVDPEHPGRVGALIDPSRLRIVRGPDRALCGVGVVGDIECRTSLDIAGYWNGGDANVAFGGGWFRPGDRGSIDEMGVLQLAGRTDDLVNAGGTKLNLAQLDLRLAEIDLFSDAASFSFTEPGGLRGVGVVFVADGDPSPDAVARAVRDHLSGLTVSRLVRVAELPRNARGKVSRIDLERWGVPS